MSAIQDAREWLAAYEGMPLASQQSGANHVRALLQEMALMGRRPADAGYLWLMANVDAQVAQATEAGNAHRHHDEDIHLRIANVRSNQAIAAAMWDGATTPRAPQEWDELTAKEADAFQSVVMAVLGASPGDVRKLPGYPDTVVHQVIAISSWTEGLTDAQVEEVCAALVEAGPWDEIDGDGTNASLIVEHIEQLGKLALSEGKVTQLQVERMIADVTSLRSAIPETPPTWTPEQLSQFYDILTGVLDDLTGWVGVKCSHGEELVVDGTILDVSPATDGDGVRLTIVGDLVPRVDLDRNTKVTVHRTRGT